jgi:amino acid permease
MLLKTAEYLSVRNYEDLVAHAFPFFGRIGTTILMNILIFGALTSFVVIIGDVTLPLVQHLPLPAHSFWVQRPFVVSALVVLVVLPLSLLRRISFLEYSSFLAVGIIALFSCLITYLGIQAAVEHKIQWHTLKLFDARPEMLFSALPIISLAYTCQLTVFPIWKELYNPSLPRMNIVVVLMTLIAFTLYSVVGFFGYCLYPQVDGNVILLLPDTIFYDIIRAVFGVAILCHYPVVHFAFRNSIEVTFFSNYQFNWIRHLVTTVATVAASSVWAILVPKLDEVFDLTGSFAAFPICFILPSLVYLKVMFWDVGIQNAELDPLLRETHHRRGSSWSRLMSPTALLAILTLVVTTICCGISIYVSILELIPKHKH